MGYPVEITEATLTWEQRTYPVPAIALAYSCVKSEIIPGRSVRFHLDDGNILGMDFICGEWIPLNNLSNVHILKFASTIALGGVVQITPRTARNLGSAVRLAMNTFRTRQFPVPAMPDDWRKDEYLATGGC